MIHIVGIGEILTSYTLSSGWRHLLSPHHPYLAKSRNLSPPLMHSSAPQMAHPLHPGSLCVLAALRGWNPESWHSQNSVPNFFLSTVSLIISREHPVSGQRSGARAWWAGGPWRRKAGSELSFFWVEAKQAPFSPHPITHCQQTSVAVTGLLGTGDEGVWGQEDQRGEPCPSLCVFSPESLCTSDNMRVHWPSGKQSYPWHQLGDCGHVPSRGVSKPCSAEHPVHVMHRKPSKFKLGWVLTLLSPVQTILRFWCSKWQ